VVAEGKAECWLRYGIACLCELRLVAASSLPTWPVVL
jgi:hypothetical protein